MWRHAVGSGLCGGPAPPCLLGVLSPSGGPRASGHLGMKNPLESMMEAVPAAAPSGSMHSVVVRALVRVLIASIDVAVARYLPAPISRCALHDSGWGTSPK